MELMMKTIDIALLDSIAGGRGNNGGDRTDNGGRNRGGRNSRNNNNSGNYYSKYGNDDCITSIIGNVAKGALAGPWGMAAGLAYGALTGGCFKESAKGGGNVGMGPGGNKSSGGCKGKGGSDGCSW
jgi:hypothetical protein